MLIKQYNLFFQFDFINKNLCYRQRFYFIHQWDIDLTILFLTIFFLL
jgi:hypothetical protein